MVNELNAFAAKEGYAIVTKSSYTQRNGCHVVHLKCDRGGRYRNRLNLTEEKRRCQTWSVLSGCPFLLVAKEDENRLWKIKGYTNANVQSMPNTDHSSQQAVQCPAEAAFDKLNGRTPMNTLPTSAGRIFEEVNFRVSHYAIRKVFEQLVLVRQPADTSSYSESFTATWEIPCAHRLRQRIAKEVVIQMGDFHSHWHLRKAPAHKPAEDTDPRKQLPHILEQVTNNFNALTNHQQIATIGNLKSLSQQAPEVAKEPESSQPRGRPKKGFHKARPLWIRIRGGCN
ncbi:hypothetical protein PsorP6_011325 [Peronosclerospora sorghi]|uniref:Uncharacterized protein n=1 Tax=Peronosclerospora sorghi TaxID=230839 RepID=A0ACC0WK80_9STRA|nr:hypothetical protein PsorP6_011325 [Peronosclerospora sorghi]